MNRARSVDVKNNESRKRISPTQLQQVVYHRPLLRCFPYEDDLAKRFEQQAESLL